jgi:hypothetical protein
MPAECRQYVYRASSLAIAGFLYAAGMAIYFGLAALLVSEGNLMTSVGLTFRGAGVLLGIAGLLLGRAAWRMIVNRRRRRQRITLGQTALILPRSFWSTSEVSIPYESITGVRCTFNRLGTYVVIRSAAGRFRIGSGALAAKQHMDELLDVLSERLQPYDVPVERREAWFAGRWTRPQFSLSSLLILTAVVAVVIGLGLYLDPQRGPRSLAFLALQMVVWGTPLLALVPWQRPGFLFAIGYVVGTVAEWSGLGYLTETGLPPIPAGIMPHPGWYPLALPIWRMIVAAGWPDIVDAFFWAMWAGQFASGVLGGIALIAVWYLGAWASRTVRRPRQAEA